ncbi:PepSY-associated TM helix domain-containing protein [Streptomyces sp. NPDC057445]|uniref:PepSY-associated TM helix domain-containing protein n=1 Tax=Streptomyces sp. NPDC057445 TaxID=3346136 RepID=UPI0036AE4DC3
MAIDDSVKPDEPATGSGTDSGPTSTSTSTWSALRPLVLRIHFYAGVLVAPLLLLAAASGLLYALSLPAEKVLYSHELTTDSGGSTIPLDTQVAAAREAHPQGTVSAVWPSYEDGATTRVLMESPEVAEEKNLTVFVDPYTGKVRGQLETSGDALPIRTWLSGLHSNLQLGETGRIYSEMAASWMWVVALGGLLLWIGRRRAARKALFLPDRAATGRRRTLSWHGSVGLWAVVGLVVLSATGLTWSTYAGANIDKIQSQLGGATPSVTATLGGGEQGGGHEGHGGGHGSPKPATGPDVGLDKVVEAARAKGVDDQIQITLPAEGEGYVVKERDRQFPVHLDSVAVDPADGRVMDTLRFEDHPLLAKLTRFGIDVHMGYLFGLLNQLALAALAVALILLVVWGYRMWWLRRPTKERRLSAGRPMPRGAWRKVPVTALMPLMAGTVLVGWFVPLLGISLLVFLVADIALGLVARTRAGSRASSHGAYL